MEGNKNLYHTHITAQRSAFDLNLKEVWRYRDLITLFTKRNFQLTYKQTVLGPVWLFLSPFITSVIHTLVFSNIAGISTNGIPAILFHLSSTAIWSFFATCLTSNAHTFTSNAHIFGKIYFPRLTVPISNILTAMIRFGIQMLMLLAFLAFYLFRGEVNPHWTAWLLLPLILIHVGVLGMGFGIIISSLTTKYRDLSILVGFGVQLWMYATPIVYPLSQLGPSRMRTLMLINPVSAPVEVFRYAILGQGEIVPWAIVSSIVITATVALLGIMIFNRVEKTFMDTV